MSNRYKGGVISATPPTTTGGEEGTASGAWTLEQQMQLQAAGLWPAQPTGPYIEQVFSTYLYAGSNSSQTITNGIDLSTKGGLVWTKARTTTYDHFLTDTIRGGNKQLSSNNTGASVTSSPAEISSFNTTGYTLAGGTVENVAGQNFVGWTFRKQPQFFDVQTFTSASSGNTTFNHNLGSTPGCVFIKNTQTSDPWIVYHTSVGNNAYLQLNSTAAQDPLTGAFSVSSTSVTISSSLMYTSQSYVAYVFASNAGGFGLTGTDNVISCGSFTTDAFKTGYATLPFSEAQWILVKCASNAGSWFIVDNMRGIYTNFTDANGLSANTSAAETTRNIDYGNSSSNSQFRIFGGDSVANSDFIYIAIRRGPMKVPTVGTSVFLPQTRTGTGAAATVSNVGFAPDLIIGRNRPVTYGVSWAWMDKLRGNTVWLDSSNTGSDAASTVSVTAFGNTGASYGADNVTTCFNYSGQSVEQFYFQRAPGFFDEVCYSGNSVAGQTYAHNLTVTPEMMIVKRRNTGGFQWIVYAAPLGASKYVALNLTDAAAGDFMWNATAPTASVFTVSANQNVNNNAGTYVAYLFATCAGVSKVGSYTGTGALQTVNCGFTSGARFVLIKRTDSTGDWWTYDSARGITSGNDPYLYLNTTDAEVTGTNYVDTDSTGFKVTAAAPAGLNASGGTYIFLAIA
jgi:hypothetical protein